MMHYEIGVCKVCNLTTQQIAELLPAGGTIVSTGLVRCYEGEKPCDMVVIPHTTECSEAVTK